MYSYSCLRLRLQSLRNEKNYYDLSKDEYRYFFDDGHARYQIVRVDAYNF